jgi:hypothetical protein
MIQYRILLHELTIRTCKSNQKYPSEYKGEMLVEIQDLAATLDACYINALTDIPRTSTEV